MLMTKKGKLKALFNCMDVHKGKLKAVFNCKDVHKEKLNNVNPMKSNFFCPMLWTSK